MRPVASLSMKELLVELELPDDARFEDVQTAYKAQLDAWNPQAFSIDGEIDAHAQLRTEEIKAVFEEITKRWHLWENRKQRPAPLELEEVEHAVEKKKTFSARVKENLAAAKARTPLKSLLVLVVVAGVIAAFTLFDLSPSDISKKVTSVVDEFSLDKENKPTRYRSIGPQKSKSKIIRAEE